MVIRGKVNSRTLYIKSRFLFYKKGLSERGDVVGKADEWGGEPVFAPILRDYFSW